MLARWCPSLQPPSWRPPKDAACARSWRSRNSPAAAAAARVTRARVCKAAWRFAPAFERNCTRSTSTACTSSSWCRRRGAAGGRGGALGGRRRLVERAPRLGRRRRGRERRVDALCSVGDGVDNEPSLLVHRDGVRARRLVPVGGIGVQIALFDPNSRRQAAARRTSCAVRRASELSTPQQHTRAVSAATAALGPRSARELLLLATSLTRW